MLGTQTLELGDWAHEMWNIALLLGFLVEGIGIKRKFDVILIEVVQRKF